MHFEGTRIPGCFVVVSTTHKDSRGFLVKTFNADSFEKQALEVEFKESYFSQSSKGVLRGLHFQLPPNEHIKMVTCVSGAIFDVVLDLRKNSPTFGEHQTFSLRAEEGKSIYIPAGLAHGFCVTSDVATTLYQTSTVYCQKSDSGVLWSSAGIDWPTNSPIISERDAALEPVQEFQTPFHLPNEVIGG